MWRGLRQLHKLLAIFKSLAQFLHPGFHPVHSVNALHWGKREGRRREDLVGNLHFCKLNLNNNKSPITRFWSHLHPKRSPFNLTCALFDDERNSIRAAVGHLRKLLSKELKAALQFLMSTLDCQGLQTAFMASQETLQHVKAHARH